ncbi:MAG: DUF3782 domain-containing protein [Magnetococcales bacterium]|nr:DUF3782 domain-containing protein [Magnetococcales bacterium]
MSAAVTFKDVWEMFQEMVREDQERRVELDRRFQETDRKFQETDLQLKETGLQLKETDLRLKETDRLIRANAAQMKETDRKIDRLGGRLGEFVEGLVAPACRNLFAERGIPVHMVSRRVEADLPGGRHLEIDLLVVNTDAVVLVEVKSKLTIDDIKDHLVRMEAFKSFLPIYADKRAFGAVAAMVIEENVRRFAIHQGLFVIEQAGDTLRMANDAAFVPRAW